MPTLTALLELQFAPNSLDDARTVLGRVLAETQAFDGCLGIEVLVDAADPARWVVLERWQSEQHDQAYREFRAGPGQIRDLGPLLAGPPKLTKFSTADIL
ncbi:putative quinol monooxygenase [Nocardia sp. NPDC057353]|uniref:putative quinol monooxygenase n=1 Tax=Nocardia sp. NPDC057353 TaxID=3346104 RepID=UPI003635520A